MASAVPRRGVQMNRRMVALSSSLVVFVAVAVLGWLALLDRGLRPALVPFVTAGAFLLGVLGVVVYLTGPRSRTPEGMTATAMLRVAVTVVVFFAGLLVSFVVLASSDWSISAVLPLFSTLSPNERWLGMLEELCLLGVPLLVVAVPESLYARGRVASSLVSGWLAGFASVLTAAFIITLHFGGIAEVHLRTAQMGALSAAAFAVAVLLAPFYRFIAKECLQQGIAAVFDPARWLSSGFAAFGEIIRAPADVPEPVADGMLASRTLAEPEASPTYRPWPGESAEDL
jgi:hypothetical protein